MKRQITALYFLLLLAPVSCPIWADDLTFDSFEAAESSAKKRAEEYQKKMQEHIKDINDQWEKQQKDLGSDASSPDISKITARQDGQKSSETEAGNSLENAVNSSVNKLKNDMINSAGPNSTGFAGGAAGYQWSVKFKGGKYVLSDSYNEAEFNTGKKKEADKSPKTEPENPKTIEETGSDATTEEITSVTPEPVKGTESTPEPVKTVSNEPEKKPADAPIEKKPADTNVNPAKPVPAQPAEEATKPLPGVNPAPTKLPPPAVRLVIQHPTDFSEETFASNATSDTPTNYQLNKFKIPEDTRIKIAVEVGQNIKPEDVSLVITDEEGDSTPVTSARLKNYRHMFRVPSDDKYSASVYVVDKKTPGKQQKKLLQVMIPVTKMDFESRTIDNQHGTKSGGGSGKESGNLSKSDTSSSAGSNNVNHSSFGQPQQVDLSDLYADPGSSSAANSDTSNSGSDNPESSAAAENDLSGAGQTNTGSSKGNDANASGNADGKTGIRGNSINGNDSSDGDGSGNANASAENSDNNAAIENNGNSGQNTSDNANDLSSSEPVTGENDNGSGDASAGTSTQSENSSGNNSNGDSASTIAGSESGADQTGSAADASGAEPADSNEPGNAGNQYATAAGVNDNASTKPGKSSSAPVTSQNPGSGEPMQEEEDAFLIGLSLRAESQKIFQSFDFIDGSNQTSSAVKAGGEIVFGLSMSSRVDPESISIKLSDGSQEIKGNLKRMGESFAYIFGKPTTDAFIELSGKASGKSFTYRVAIPVKAN